MKRIVSTLLCFIACITTATAKEEVQEIVEQIHDFQPGQVLTVKSINGKISIQNGNHNQIHMVATKKAKANTEEEADEILDNTYIQVTPTGNGLEIVTKHPPKDMLRKGKNINVTYELTVPKSIILDVRTTNGKIEIAPTIGDVTAKTTNGDIDLEGTEGTVHTQTTNGDIEVENVMGFVNAKTTNGSIDLDHIQGGIKANTTNGSVDVDLTDEVDVPIQIQTTNGSIDLTLPMDFKAQLQAQTVNGKMSTDFPITVKGRFSGKSINGALNGGGDNTISLQTVNGSIKIEH